MAANNEPRINPEKHVFFIKIFNRSNNFSISRSFELEIIKKHHSPIYKYQNILLSMSVEVNQKVTFSKLG